MLDVQARDPITEETLNIADHTLIPVLCGQKEFFPFLGRSVQACPLGRAGHGDELFRSAVPEFSGPEIYHTIWAG